MTSFVGYVQQLILEKLGPGARLDAKRLTLSLMVLSADRKQLVIVAGTTPDKSFVLDIGDGNAGRAWKRGRPAFSTKK